MGKDHKATYYCSCVGSSSARLKHRTQVTEQIIRTHHGLICDPDNNFALLLSKSVFRHKKNAPVTVIDIRARRPQNLMQFPANVAHKYYLEFVLPMLIAITQYPRQYFEPWARRKLLYLQRVPEYLTYKNRRNILRLVTDLLEIYVYKLHLI